MIQVNCRFSKVNKTPSRCLDLQTNRRRDYLSSKTSCVEEVNVKVKFIPEGATKAQTGSRINSSTLDLGARWVWVVKTTSR